jgi:hypothetical protein
MNQTDSTKQMYMSPAIEVIRTTLNCQLMQTSFPNNGGHNKADDDGGDINDAKQGLFYEDEDEDDSLQLWKL